MSIKNEKTGKWGCMFCLEEFIRAIDAESHQQTHDFVLVPMLKSEISGLVQYIYQSDGNKELIPYKVIERMKRLQRHTKNKYE